MGIAVDDDLAVNQRGGGGQKARRGAGVAEKKRGCRRLQFAAAGDNEGRVVRLIDRDAHGAQRFGHIAGIVALQRAGQPARALGKACQQQGAVGDRFRSRRHGAPGQRLARRDNREFGSTHHHSLWSVRKAADGRRSASFTALHEKPIAEISELYRGNGAICFVGDLEIGLLDEAEGAGDEIVRESLDLDVQIARCTVVIAARHLDLVFRRLQRLLQLDEARIGLQVGIGFGNGHQAAKRLAEDAFGCGTAGDIACRHGLGRIARLGDFDQRLVLMAGIAFDRLDQIGNEIGAALQLHVDAGPCFLRNLARANEPIVDEDDIECGQHYDCEKNEHLKSPGRLQPRGH
ncbi:hypothetical protein RHSP_02688 [Rhizobium freirei PRF 81]|uniref:Uncharacterized protein n=1 Tax=Rhizobium freirei PRF 81 TaxID=363754 RepID=N6U8V3_9HYPH|nr:hypothetical protein RHSP_02688 [Rhizobium freirei PRF 81]